MEKKEKKIKKEIMPEEMLKEYMISKNIDKAVNKRAAWNKERKNMMENMLYHFIRA